MMMQLVMTLVGYETHIHSIGLDADNAMMVNMPKNGVMISYPIGVSVPKVNAGGAGLCIHFFKKKKSGLLNDPIS